MRGYDLRDGAQHLGVVYSDANVEFCDILRWGDCFYRWDGSVFMHVDRYAHAALELHPGMRTKGAIYRFRGDVCSMVGNMCLRFDAQECLNRESNVLGMTNRYGVWSGQVRVMDVEVEVDVNLGDILRFGDELYEYQVGYFERVHKPYLPTLQNAYAGFSSGWIYTRKDDTWKALDSAYVVPGTARFSFEPVREFTNTYFDNKTARGTEHAHTQGDNMQHSFRQFTRGDIGGYMAICRQWNADLNDYELELFTPRAPLGNGSILYTCRDKLEQEIKESCSDTEYLIVTFQDYVNMELKSAL